MTPKRTMSRIRATEDLPEHGVKAGDIGGKINGYHNLHGRSWLGVDARIGAMAVVTDGSLVFGQARVGSSALVRDSLIFEDARVYDNAIVESSIVTGNVHIGGETHLFRKAAR